MMRSAQRRNLVQLLLVGHGFGCIGAATQAASHDDDQQSAGDDNDPHYCDPKQTGVPLHDISLDEQADVGLTCRLVVRLAPVHPARFFPVADTEVFERELACSIATATRGDQATATCRSIQHLGRGIA